MTNNDIFKEFLENVNEKLKEKIIDYRPCRRPCYPENIENTICIYFADGGELLYKAQNAPVSSFEDICNIISQLAKKELHRANLNNPAFNSMHEGIGVIFEEIHEAQMENNDIPDYFAEIVEKNRIGEDCTQAIDELKNSAIKCSAELVQVIAMCDKMKAVE